MSKNWKDERQSIIMFDVLIIGGVFPAYFCLVLGSAKDKNFAADKGWRFHHQKSSLQEAVFNNAYRIPGIIESVCWYKANTYPNSTHEISKKILRIGRAIAGLPVTTACKIRSGWLVDQLLMVVFCRPHRSHCQKNKESITQYRSQKAEHHVAGTLAGWKPAFYGQWRHAFRYRPLLTTVFRHIHDSDDKFDLIIPK
jgi:hypothetical protein